jgi:hypothetical protein
MPCTRTDIFYLAVFALKILLTLTYFLFFSLFLSFSLFLPRSTTYILYFASEYKESSVHAFCSESVQFGRHLQESDLDTSSVEVTRRIPL